MKGELLGFWGSGADPACLFQLGPQRWQECGRLCRCPRGTFRLGLTGTVAGGPGQEWGTKMISLPQLSRASTKKNN